MGWYKSLNTAKSEPLQPATLADMQQDGLLVFCWCNRCGHNAALDPAILIATLGPLYPIPEIGHHMRCSACQTRDIATRPHWPAHVGKWPGTHKKFQNKIMTYACQIALHQVVVFIIPAMQ